MRNTAVVGCGFLRQHVVSADIGRLLDRRAKATANPDTPAPLNSKHGLSLRLHWRLSW